MGSVIVKAKVKPGGTTIPWR